jgi:hypothetical protein
MNAWHRSSHRSGAGGHCRRAPGPMLLAAATLMVIPFLTACPSPAPPVPTDAQDFCPLDAATFAGWFQSGSVALNGVVNPADSLVSLAPNCGFYQWSEQMFMWLTSPAPAVYGGGAHIFDSPTFFDVTPPDAMGKRTFIAHTAGLIRPFPLRNAKLGPHRLPVIMDRSGRLLEARPADPKLKPVVRDLSGKLVEIAHARLENGRAILLDGGGKVIAAMHSQTVRLPGAQGGVSSAATAQKVSPEGVAIEPRDLNSAFIVQRFMVDRIPIFLDPFSVVIDVEQGEADDGVLEAQATANGSLVYYATMVNDVYAYFLTGAKDGAITTDTPNQFPTTANDLNNTIAFAMAHGKPNPPFPDPHALAIEVKSSWVVAAGLPNLSSYITMDATIPTYDTSSSTVWKPTGSQTVQLALVGMHVVGSTLGHPEMVWATFEHVGNTPVSTYTYNSTSGPQPATVAQNTSGTWLFAANNASAPFNQQHMFFAGPSGTPPNSIQALMGFTISPSDTIRSMPFGTDGTDSSSNTEIISMDNHVLSMMASGDVRGNYVMTGTTWTPFGSNPGPFNLGVGTAKLANTTMETYMQGSNCFSCHQSGANLTTDISHVFPGLQPLF